MAITNANVLDWTNTNTGKIQYGVKVKVDGGEWRNLAIDGEHYLVPTWKEARAKCRELLGLPKA